MRIAAAVPVVAGERQRGVQCPAQLRLEDTTIQIEGPDRNGEGRQGHQFAVN